MGNFFRGIIRASSFFRKEIFEILRQPRLVATLVLGPFLILFIFGIGYRAQSRILRTLFVAQPTAHRPRIFNSMGKPWARCSHMPGSMTTRPMRSTSCNKASRPGHCGARGRYNTIKNNQQAILTLYHHEIDPVKVSYITYLGWLYAGVVNQQVLRSFAVQGQTNAADVQTNLQAAHQNAAAMRLAVQSGDETLAQAETARLEQQLG